MCAAMRAEPRRFEAVVSDEVMPELTGTQLAVEVLGEQPPDLVARRGLHPRPPVAPPVPRRRCSRCRANR